jgi:hypothetical protein
MVKASAEAGSEKSERSPKKIAFNASEQGPKNLPCSRDNRRESGNKKGSNTCLA